jgi:predicted AAA+ superfamily ATPase
VLTGPRRAGKSFYVYEIQQKLWHKSNKRIVYLNFEDDRLNGFNNQHFDLILEAYYELHTEKPVLFLYEVHVIKGWETFVRRLANTGYKVVVTGSNSHLLSKEIAEKLGARFIETNIFSLDFKEFLKFKNFKINPETVFSKEHFTLKKLFNEYLSFGGFPEVAMLNGEEAKRKVLQTYFDLVFFKDIVGRKK